jgi:hypothetical protein
MLSGKETEEKEEKHWRKKTAELKLRSVTPFLPANI